MHEGHNLWVLKANDMNRGRGIHLFNNIEQLKKLIYEYTQGKEIEIKKDTNNTTGAEQTKEPKENKEVKEQQPHPEQPV